MIAICLINAFNFHKHSKSEKRMMGKSVDFRCNPMCRGVSISRICWGGISQEGAVGRWVGGGLAGGACDVMTPKLPPPPHITHVMSRNMKRFPVHAGIGASCLCKCHVVICVASFASCARNIRRTICALSLATSLFSSCSAHSSYTTLGGLVRLLSRPSP